MKGGGIVKHSAYKVYYNENRGENMSFTIDKPRFEKILAEKHYTADYVGESVADHVAGLTYKDMAEIFAGKPFDSLAVRTILSGIFNTPWDEFISSDEVI